MVITKSQVENKIVSGESHIYTFLFHRICSVLQSEFVSKLLLDHAEEGERYNIQQNDLVLQKHEKGEHCEFRNSFVL